MDNIQINFNDTDLTEELTLELKTYIEKKLRSIDKLIDLNSDGVTGDIRLNKDSQGQKSGKIYRVEISFTTPGKKYGANAEGNSWNEAIDLAKDAVTRKISENKDKKQNLLKKGGTQVKNFLKKFSK